MHALEIQFASLARPLFGAAFMRFIAYLGLCAAYLQGGIRAAAARCGEDVVRYVAAVNAATRQFLVLSAAR